MVKSYNLHPRSERSDTEIAMLVDDTAFGRKMTDMFENDIHPDRARFIEKAEDVRYNENFIDGLFLNLSMRLGYDAL
jgi:phosphatidylserine/phosphatidylglycerophosphate/cardiolipin synthase-like enzyme